MYVVVTGYILKDGNDIRKGGTVVPIAMIRVGKMIKAKKDSYKRVYREDGTYHYPKCPQNLLCKAGNYYFEGLELTGSNEGTDKNPKISLLKLYREQIIPAIERKIVDAFSENGKYKVLVVKQEDNAGLHGESTYLREMKTFFWFMQQWILFNQPPQSPTLNVHDACIFPMLSKCVSMIQALFYRARLLKGEDLYHAVKKAWEDENNKLAMARAFAGHHQIVSAVLHHKGDNTYLSEKGGLSFGVRKLFVPDVEGTGVVAVPLAPENVAETATGSFLIDQEVTKMKYPTPSLDMLPDATLTPEMIQLLDEYMDQRLMSPQLKQVWKNLYPEFDPNRSNSIEIPFLSQNLPLDI